MRGQSRKQRKRRVDELLDLVALDDQGHKMVDELSSGQRQRVAIARALAVEPQVLPLDEPLSALDLKLRQHMRRELRAIQQRVGLTLIYITHDQGEALTMSDRSNWNSLHLTAFATTIIVSIFVTLFNFVFCYPIAFYMAQVATAARVRLLLLLLIAPYWINELLQAFAFCVMFAGSGVLNRALQWLGAIAEPFDFLGNNVALLMGLSYAYLLLLVFPLNNAVESLDRRQIEAARDPGRALAAHPPVHRDAACQAWDRQRVHTGVHANIGCASGPFNAGRAAHFVVHTDRL